MPSAHTNAEPIVESPLHGDDVELTLRSLRQRIRQQEILAELGVIAMQGASFDHLINETARLVAEGLRAEFSKVLEHIPSENRFVVRAGVGWGPGVVGIASVGADLGSPAGFALRTGRSVISNHLANEERFRTPEILRQHGIHRAMNVILQGDGRPFGVLEVDSRSDEEFVEDDLAFLQGAANLLGMAIERERHESHLKAALERHEALLKEMSHRVKNSLAIVASMLRLQASGLEDSALAFHLENASHRVTAVARAHDQLFQSTDIDQMDIGRYIEAVCRDIDASVPRCDIDVDVKPGIFIATDRALSAALIVNELIMNAAKYAYADHAGGRIWVTVAGAPDDSFTISVRDAGRGLPTDFDLQRTKGLGMRIIGAFAKQLASTVVVRRRDPGAEFVLTIPRQAPP